MSLYRALVPRQLDNPRAPLDDGAMSPLQSRRGFVKACAALPLLSAASSFQVHVRAAEAKQPFATDNEKINQARDVALGLLKPTPKQLEHGLRAHAESLVFESYGSAP